ncbi:MAG: ABC transporter ATP-binding protein [Candidatus Abawacabacteria bacterium]|nr:ABC transporter ATP-binding protein [Candidatus Abawacabacteria bacterium]
MAKNVWQIYLAHLRPYRTRALATVAMIAFAETMSSVTLWQFSRVVGNMSTSSFPLDNYQWQTLVWQLVTAFLCLLISWLSWRCSGFLTASTLPRVAEDLENTAFQHLLTQSQSFFLDNFAGSLVKKVRTFSAGFYNTAETVLWRITPLLLALLSMTIIISFYKLWIGAAILGGISFVLAMNIIFFYVKRALENARAAKDSEVTGFLADILSNQMNVKLFAASEQENRAFQKLNHEKSLLMRATVFTAEKNFVLQNAINLTVEVVILGTAFYYWSINQLSLGDYVLIQSYVFSLMTKFWDIGKVVKVFYTAWADGKEMTDILNTPGEIQDVVAAKELLVSQGTINFTKLSFSYHERPVLKDFTLAITAGEKIAIVGPSGAGKSTLVKLLLRFYDVPQGSITIDHQDIKQVSQKSLWQSIAFVPQDPVLFHRTLFENIRYGTTASLAEVQTAAKQAYCHEFITQLPKGYDTYVGERGIKLSGGERQRVAIARAILKNAPILVLDEATSSLDSESESLIQAALKNLMHNKTTIVIAHRLSTIMQMDRIVVIDKGQVVDTGTHQSLLSRDGLYQKLWSIQAGKYN